MPVLIDSNIDLEKAKEYRLSIQSNLNGFSFCITDTSADKCIYLRKSDFSIATDGKEGYLKKCARMVESIPMLGYRYKSVQIIIDTEKYTLVPLQLFNENEVLRNLSALYEIEEDEEVAWVKVEEMDLVILYAINSTLLNILKRVQPEFETVPSILHVLRKLQKRTDHNKLYLSFIKGKADVTLFVGSQLLHCCSYPANDFTSALYFAFLALKQAFINPENTTVFIHGDIYVPEIQLLTKYFPMVKYFRSRRVSLGSSSLEMKYSLLTIQ